MTKKDAEKIFKENFLTELNKKDDGDLRIYDTKLDKDIDLLDI